MPFAGDRFLQADPRQMVLFLTESRIIFARVGFFAAGLALATVFADVLAVTFAGVALAAAFVSLCRRCYGLCRGLLLCGRFLLAMGVLQQRISVVAHPHASSTTTTRPHTSQLRTSPFFAFAIICASFWFEVDLALPESGPNGVFQACEITIHRVATAARTPVLNGRCSLEPQIAHLFTVPD